MILTSLRVMILGSTALIEVSLNETVFMDPRPIFLGMGFALNALLF